MPATADVFPPGEFLKDELEARGWSQTELAEIMGRPVRLINEIIAGKKGITPETAVQLSHSLGTTPELWMNLESQYQLSKVRPVDDLVARRARLYERFAVREMIKRGWIEASKSIDVLEQQFRAFFGIDQLDAPIVFSHAAKKTHPEEQSNKLQLAWLFRARALARALKVPRYSPDSLRALMPRLSALLAAPEEARQVPKLLAECGVRFVVVEPIPGTKLDGACFWLEDGPPVIAMSLRLDRIDNFWFVVRHELEHVLNGDGRERGFILELDLEGSDPASEEERLANAAAQRFCVDQAELSHFIARVNPFFSEERVLGFAQRLKIHPGLVVGQLQRHLKRYDFLRKHQVKVRAMVSAAALTDGWGVVHAV